MILKNIPEGAEVLEIVAHIPQTAYNAGVREANNRTARGYMYGCIGVVETVKTLDALRYHLDENGFAVENLEVRTMTIYQPVLQATE